MRIARNQSPYRPFVFSLTVLPCCSWNRILAGIPEYRMKGSAGVHVGAAKTATAQLRGQLSRSHLQRECDEKLQNFAILRRNSSINLSTGREIKDDASDAISLL